MNKIYKDTKERLLAPTPKEAKKKRFWYLLGSALSTVGTIAANVVSLGVLSSSAGKWVMGSAAVVSAIGAFIEQLKTE